MQTKQDKIDMILAILSGEIAPEDVNPDCTIKIGYPGGTVYIVNGKEVPYEQFQVAEKRLAATDFRITYGGEDL